MRITPTIPWEVLGEGPWAPPEIPTVVQLPIECDVLVVGAGITGLTAAMTLAQAKREVLVIDRHVGHSATTRAGGIIVGETLVGPAPGFDRCEEALRQWIDRDAPSVTLDWTGCWELERDNELSSIPVDWRDSGTVRRARTISGGTLDPSALLSALGTAAASHGVKIVDHVALEAYERGTDSITVFTNGGRLQARRVLVATDATGRPVDDDWWADRSLTVVLATEPLTEQQVDAIGWDGQSPFFTNDSPLLWGRPLEGGSMMVGRELVPIGDGAIPRVKRAIEAAGEKLAWRVRHLDSSLASLGVKRIWAGPIARDAGGVPGLREDRGVRGAFWAGGYGGHGLAQAFRLGSLAAQRLLT
jgi:glycine/D-amino acid oxidase-like deaminating enzyme